MRISPFGVETLRFTTGVFLNQDLRRMIFLSANRSQSSRIYERISEGLAEQIGFCVSHINSFFGHGYRGFYGFSRENLLDKSVVDRVIRQIRVLNSCISL